MHPWSQNSLAVLQTCDANLVRLFNRVAETWNCKAIEGFRGEEKQNEYFNEGRTTVRYPDGKHNVFPSKAIDIGPHPIRWPALPANRNPTRDEAEIYAKELGRWHQFIGFVFATAKAMDINVRNGSDWDGDHDLRDQTFDDLVHWELTE